MKPYLAIFSARFRMLLQYRAAALAGIGTQVFFGLVRMMIFQAFYRSADGGASQPMTVQQVVDYVWLGQAFLLLTLVHLDGDVASMIRSGSVAFELCRPVDLFSLWYARALSGRLAPLALRAAPILALAAIFFGLSAPVSWSAGLMFVASLASAVLLASAITTIITLSLLWTVSGEGISRFAPALIFFLSGMIIPLPLFPAWSQPIINALPFRGLIDIPFRIYMGHLSMSEGAAGILHQLLWTAGLMLLGRWALSRGLRRLVVQGG